jgi:hypothetical protein
MEPVPELVEINTEHILRVLATVHTEQDLQGGPYGLLIFDLLYLVQILRGYSPDPALLEGNRNYLGHGTLALQDTNPTAIQNIITALQELPTGHAAHQAMQNTPTVRGLEDV